MLALSAAILAGITWGLKRRVPKVWQIWRSWVVMAPLALLIVGLGREATIAGVTLLAIFGFKEFARATGLYRDWGMTGMVYLAIVAVGAAAVWPDWDAGGTRAGWWDAFEAMPIFAVVLILLAPIVWDRTQGQLQAVALATLGFLYVGWMFAHLGFMANSAHAYGYIAFVVFAVEICDISAYTCGKLFGQRPLRSNISPRKTWGGSLGALAVAMALPWALGFSFPPAFGWRAKVVAGLIVGVGGQLGDLSISLIKRDLGLKDMGAVIPGHGGILDRIDSLIIVAPLFAWLVNWIEPLR
ncbi:MAG: Phosphatidate cytidylyltransferase [Phycisphaerales bacterium]|nr:Phosphatidate cytidylyltransferase [Phycisphaerales bacterium]